MRKVFETVASASATGDEPEIVISTVTPDREGDEIIPEGCDVTAYLRNPVVLFQHDYEALPIGSTTRIEIVPRGIKARWRWLENDAFAARVRNAYDQGVLRAASVGIRVIAKEPNEHGGQRITRSELLEWSPVAVPANPEAVRTLKALGLSHDDDEIAVMLRCDDWDQVALHLLDDEPTAVSNADVAAALPNAIRQAFGELIAREARSAVARSRGRILDSPIEDVFVPRVCRHRRPHEASLLRVDYHEVAEALRAVVPQSLRDSVREAVERAMRLSRGRVD